MISFHIANETKNSTVLRKKKSITKTSRKILVKITKLLTVIVKIPFANSVYD